MPAPHPNGVAFAMRRAKMDAAQLAPGWNPPSELERLAGDLVQVVRPQIDIETAREAARAVLDVVARRAIERA